MSGRAMRRLTFELMPVDPNVPFAMARRTKRFDYALPDDGRTTRSKLQDQPGDEAG